MKLSVLWCGAAIAAAAAAQSVTLPKFESAAWTDPATYVQTFWITPNSADIPLAAPMVKRMLAAGDPSTFGGGDKVKAGMTIDLSFTRFTEGYADDFKYYVNRGPEWSSSILPPDVTSLSQLPAEVLNGFDAGSALDDIPAWATTAKCPRVIAALEWARYHNVPLTIQLQIAGPQGGEIDYLTGQPIVRDLDAYFETDPTIGGKNQCAWDASDYCDPDDNPFTPSQDVPGTAGFFTYTTPTMADPAVAATLSPPITLNYRSYYERNLRMSLDQLGKFAALPRYAGRLVAIALIPEFHLPSHTGSLLPNPQNPAQFTARPFFGDYHPAVVRQFQIREEARYGDSAPAVDSNGDGRTFWGDFEVGYEASGSAAHPHPANVPPATWASVDPPRKNLLVPAFGDPRYWHEWTTFRAEMVEEFLEWTVDIVRTEGVPDRRIFTHQTMANASIKSNRMFDNGGGNYFDWCDDWIHFESSGAVPGASIYQPFNAVNGEQWYANIEARDTAWGIPEYNPYVLQPGVTWATQQQTHDAVWQTRPRNAHVIWPHHWGSTDFAAFDTVATSWGKTGAALTGWSTVNLTPIPAGAPTNLQATTAGNSYLETNAGTSHLPFAASAHPYFVASMVTTFIGSTGPTAVGNLRWQNSVNPGVWYQKSIQNIRNGTPAYYRAVVELEGETGWTGNITKLQLYVTPAVSDHVGLDRVYFAKANLFTSELKSLAASYDGTARVEASNAFAPALPIDLAERIVDASAAGNLAVFGADPLAGNNWNDFGTAGNFEKKASATAGGVSRKAISSPAPARLGMRKTGRFKRLTIPNVPDLYLTFRRGLEDGAPATVDGVSFRVTLRDQIRNVHELSKAEHRTHAWSNRVDVPLASYVGQTVDLSFETRGMNEATGDRSAWGEPRIARMFSVAASVTGLGGGTLSPDPNGLQEYQTTIPLTADVPVGSTFVRWETDGNPADIADLFAPSTTLYISGPQTVRAVVGVLLAPNSVVAEDGYVIESSETSNIGGTLDAGQSTAYAIAAGDDVAKKQVKSVTSFDTSGIPANATIHSATLTLVRGGVFGDPAATLGSLVVDVVPGNFGQQFALETRDFQSAPATQAVAAATLNVPTTNGAAATGSFGAAGIAAVNRTGKTQVRLRFTTDDDNDATYDAVTFWSGEAATTSNRPKLSIVYY